MMSSSKCTRGAATAATAPRSWSTTPTIVCSSAERIRLEPDEPSARCTSPSSSTTVGDIIDGIRRPGGARWKPSGLRSASPMMLLTWMPVPGTTMPEPSPFVHVTEHARPSPSMTEMCVVEPIRDASSRAPNAGSPSPSTNSAVRAACASSIARTTSASGGGDSVWSSSCSDTASRIPPADGGGFVSTSRPR